MERDDEPTIRMKNVAGATATGAVSSIDVKLDRIEKLLETINLRLSAMGGAWRPPNAL